MIAVPAPQSCLLDFEKTIVCPMLSRYEAAYLRWENGKANHPTDTHANTITCYNQFCRFLHHKFAAG